MNIASQNGGANAGGRDDDRGERRLGERRLDERRVRDRRDVDRRDDDIRHERFGDDDRGDHARAGDAARDGLGAGRGARDAGGGRLADAGDGETVHAGERGERRRRRGFRRPSPPGSRRTPRGAAQLRRASARRRRTRSRRARSVRTSATSRPSPTRTSRSASPRTSMRRPRSRCRRRRRPARARSARLTTSSARCPGSRRSSRPSQFKVLNNAARFTQQQLTGVLQTLIEGICFTGVAMLFFLRSWRNAIVVMIAIPTSLCVTLFVMKLVNFTIDTVSLLAMTLIIGILVDDSIVVLENVERHFEDGEAPRTAAILGRTEIGPAAIVITLVDVVVFLPIAFLPGQTGRFLGRVRARRDDRHAHLARRLVHRDAVARRQLVAALELARPRADPRLHPRFRAAARVLRASGSCRGRCASRFRSFVASLVLTGAAIALIPLGVVGFEFIPAVDRGQIFCTVQFPTGTPLTTTDAAVRLLSARFLQLPGVADDHLDVGDRASRVRRRREPRFDRADSRRSRRQPYRADGPRRDDDERHRTSSGPGCARLRRSGDGDTRREPAADRRDGERDARRAGRVGAEGAAGAAGHAGDDEREQLGAAALAPARHRVRPRARARARRADRLRGAGRARGVRRHARDAVRQLQRNRDEVRPGALSDGGSDEGLDADEPADPRAKRSDRPARRLRDAQQQPGGGADHADQPADGDSHRREPRAGIRADQGRARLHAARRGAASSVVDRRRRGGGRKPAERRPDGAGTRDRR